MSEKVPLDINSLVTMGAENESKARTALEEEKYRRAADKGVYACGYYAEAISKGRLDLTDNFHGVALLTLYASAMHTPEYFSWIDTPVLEDYQKIHLEPPTHALVQIREYAANLTLLSQNDLRGYMAIQHARVILNFDKIKARELMKKAATIGLEDLHKLSQPAQEGFVFQYYKEEYEAVLRTISEEHQ